MGNIQEKVHRLVTCCRICTALGLGQVSIELNGRFAIESNERTTYRFENFDALEQFLENTLMRRTKDAKPMQNKHISRRLAFLREMQQATDAGKSEVTMRSAIR